MAKSIVTGFYLTLLMSCFLFWGGCSQEDELMMFSTDLQATEQIRGIIVEGPWYVRLSQSNGQNGAVVEFNKEAEKHISYEYRDNGYLHLWIKNSCPKNISLQLAAYITTTHVEKIQLSGGAEMSCFGAFKNSLSSISLSGASSLKGFQLSGDTINISMSGASKIDELSFSGTNGEFDLSGASALKNSVINTTKLFVVETGGSRFTSSGKTESAKIIGSGASSFHTRNLIADNLNIHLSGASFGEAFVNEKITGSLSGASRLTHNVDADVSGLALDGSSHTIIGY